MVPRAPPPTDQGAMGRPEEEAPRAFRVLRDPRQYREPRSLPVPRDSCLAQVAQPPLGQGLDPVGAFQRVGAALPAASGSAEGHPSGHVANSWREEPGARIGHARICGGPRWATAPAYPTAVV